jgi:hypothetical protein
MYGRVSNKAPEDADVLFEGLGPERSLARGDAAPVELERLAGVVRRLLRKQDIGDPRAATVGQGGANGSLVRLRTSELKSLG